MQKCKGWENDPIGKNIRGIVGRGDWNENRKGYLYLERILMM